MITACQRLTEKFGGTETHTALGSQYRHTMADGGLIVATWILRKDRLSYSSGFLFGGEGLVKLSARDLTKLLETESARETGRAEPVSPPKDG